jgi:hypothetical protein
MPVQPPPRVSWFACRPAAVCGAWLAVCAAVAALSVEAKSGAAPNQRQLPAPLETRCERKSAGLAQCQAGRQAFPSGHPGGCIWLAASRRCQLKGSRAGRLWQDHASPELEDTVRQTSGKTSRLCRLNSQGWDPNARDGNGACGASVLAVQGLENRSPAAGRARKWAVVPAPKACMRPRPSTLEVPAAAHLRRGQCIASCLHTPCVQVGIAGHLGNPSWGQQASAEVPQLPIARGKAC